MSGLRLLHYIASSIRSAGSVDLVSEDGARPRPAKEGTHSDEDILEGNSRRWPGGGDGHT